MIPCPITIYLCLIADGNTLIDAINVSIQVTNSNSTLPTFYIDIIIATYCYSAPFFLPCYDSCIF